MESWPSPWPAQTGGNVRSANQRAALSPADQWGDRKCTLSVIVICVSTALWFPTSAPPSPPTSETHKKCVITISYLSQWWSLTQHHQLLPITPRHPYATHMRIFSYHEVSQRNIVVLVCTESHALAVKSNLGKIWSNRNFKIFIWKSYEIGEI